MDKIQKEIDNLDKIDWEVFNTMFKISEFVGGNYPKQKKYEYQYNNDIYVCNFVFEYNNIKWYINVWRKEDKGEFDIPFPCMPIMIDKSTYTLNIKINNKFLKKIFNQAFQDNYKNLFIEKIKCNFYSSFNETEVQKFCVIFKMDVFNLFDFDLEIDETYETYQILSQIEDNEKLQNAIKMFALFYNIKYKQESKHRISCIFEEDTSLLLMEF